MSQTRLNTLTGIHSHCIHGGTHDTRDTRNTHPQPPNFQVRIHMAAAVVAAPEGVYSRLRPVLLLVQAWALWLLSHSLPLAIGLAEVLRQPLAPAQSVPDLTTERRPRVVCVTLRKCRACHTIQISPCKSAAPATKSAPDLAEVLRLPRNLRVVCLQGPDPVAVLRLPRKLRPTLRKCCACHMG